MALNSLEAKKKKTMTWTLLIGMDVSDTEHLEATYLDKWMNARMR